MVNNSKNLKTRKNQTVILYIHVSFVKYGDLSDKLQIQISGPNTNF